MLSVLPMTRADEVVAVADAPGALLLPSPPTLEPNTPLGQQVLDAAIAAGIDEPTELADIAVDLLDAEPLLEREPWPFSRGELQIGAFLLVIGQPFRQLALVDPTAGLDARRRRAMVDFLVGLADEGHRITVASDDDLFS